jgi:hypothetical protein
VRSLEFHKAGEYNFKFITLCKNNEFYFVQALIQTVVAVPVMRSKLSVMVEICFHRHEFHSWLLTSRRVAHNFEKENGFFRFVMSAKVENNYDEFIGE